MDINTKGLEKYYGSTFKGIKLNKHNLAAAAQLGGRGTVNKLLSGRSMILKMVMVLAFLNI